MVAYSGFSSFTILRSPIVSVDCSVLMLCSKLLTVFSPVWIFDRMISPLEYGCIAGNIYHSGIQATPGGIVGGYVVPYFYKDILQGILSDLFVCNYFENDTIKSTIVLPER